MRDITREEYEEMTLEEIMSVLSDHDEITSCDCLKEYAKEKVDDGNYFLAIHILEALQECEADYYIYDYCMGTLTSPTAIEDKEDVEHLFYFDEQEC